MYLGSLQRLLLLLLGINMSYMYNIYVCHNIKNIIKQ